MLIAELRKNSGGEHLKLVLPLLGVLHYRLLMLYSSGYDTASCNVQLYDSILPTQKSSKSIKSRVYRHSAHCQNFSEFFLTYTRNSSCELMEDPTKREGTTSLSKSNFNVTLSPQRLHLRCQKSILFTSDFRTFSMHVHSCCEKTRQKGSVLATWCCTEEVQTNSVRGCNSIEWPSFTCFPADKIESYQRTLTPSANRAPDSFERVTHESTSGRYMQRMRPEGHKVQYNRKMYFYGLDGMQRLKWRAEAPARCAIASLSKRVGRRRYSVLLL